MLHINTHNNQDWARIEFVVLLSQNVYTLKKWKHTILSYFHSFFEKTHLLTFKLILISSSWRVYMHIKFDIWNERLEWYKKLSMFAKWATQNNPDALAFIMSVFQKNSWIIFKMNCWFICHWQPIIKLHIENARK